MANTGTRGIDVRQTGTGLVFRASLKDSSGAKVTSGTTTFAIYEVQTDGTLKSYDFSSNTFKTTALTTATAAMTHRQGNNSTVNTGVWTAALATLTGFTNGAIYVVQVNNSGASPTDQEREFQYGNGEGDLTVDASGRVDLGKTLGTAITLDANNVLNVAVSDWNGTALGSLGFPTSGNVTIGAFTAGSLTAAAIAAGALTGKGDWLGATLLTVKSPLAANKVYVNAPTFLFADGQDVSLTYFSGSGNWHFVTGIIHNAIDANGSWVDLNYNLYITPSVGDMFYCVAINPVPPTTGMISTALQTTMSSQGYTSARATNLGNLDVAVSTRAITGFTNTTNANVIQIGGTNITTDANNLLNVNVKDYNGTATTLMPLTDKSGYSLSGSQAFNIAGNLSGSVGSVTGAVGSVTGTVGAAASVTAPVTVGTNNDKSNYMLAASQTFSMSGNISGNISGNVTGSVGSVAGNVSGSVGSVSGTVGTALGIAAGGITSASFATGSLPAASGIKKNTALAGFEFVMTDSTTHTPKTAVTVTATRSLDGAAFGACANAVAELSNGVYTINLAAADLNANVVTLRLTGTASDDLLVTIITQP